MRSITLILGLSCLLGFSNADRGKAKPNYVFDVSCNTAPTDSSDPTRRFRRGQAGATLSKIADSYNAYHVRSLLKRGGKVTYDKNCDDPPPENSGYKKKDFPTKRSAIEAAYADTLQLADGAKEIDPNGFAFTHYFGGAKTDLQLQHFKDMMDAIASEDQYYNIVFECSGTGGDCQKNSVANTDVTTGTSTDLKAIHICNDFWTLPSTKYLIYRDDKTTPNPPFRTKDNKGWCRKGNDENSSRRANFFATAGHTILHELTHLDSLAAKAGLSADPNNKNQHGTYDAQDGKKDGCELEGARKYRDRYKADTTGDLASPDYNAESYAGAATENFFMKLCTFKEIRPLDPVTSTGPEGGGGGDPNSIPDPKCAGDNPTDGPVDFHQPDADKLINDFCGNRAYWGQVIVPAVSVGTGLTSDGRHKALGMSDSRDVNSGDKLYISLAFAENDCMGTFQFDIGQTDDERMKHCTDRFGKINNGCNSGGSFPKYGGTLDDVCAIYTLTARKRDAPDPTRLKSQGDLGDFVCVDTDASALGPESPLKNTCTCHYANVPGPTDVFKKPPSGNCKDTNKADLLTN